MKYKKLAIVLVAIFSMSTLTGFGLKDLKPDLDKCNSSKCKDKEKLKSVAKVVAIGVAAKLLADMVVKYNSKQTKSEQVVINEKKAKNQQLPAKAAVDSYVTTILPSKVVKIGQAATVQSVVYVSPGLDGKAIKVEEKLELLDAKNESMNQHVKQVATGNQKGGEFTNQFSFTIPEGLPDGVYTVKNAIIINGQQQKVTNTSVQFVLRTQLDSGQQFALLY